MNTRIILIACLFALVAPLTVSAHPGNTDSSGCHTCKTNCPNWGLSYGEYHCHNAKSSYQPEAPIRSTYGAGGAGSTQYWPEYEYQSSQPSCPIHSSYNSVSGSCKCNYGYLVKGSSCVDADSVCWDEAGYNSSYDSLSNSCKCDSGYRLGSSGQCISNDNYCSAQHGYGAEYDILSKSCACKDGYINDGSNRCTNATSYCMNTFGTHSSFDETTDSCTCDYGYELVGGQCEEIEEPKTSSAMNFSALLEAVASQSAQTAPNKPVNKQPIVENIDRDTSDTSNILPNKATTSPGLLAATTPVVSTTSTEITPVQDKSLLRRFFNLLRGWIL